MVSLALAARLFYGTLFLFTTRLWLGCSQFQPHFAFTNGIMEDSTESGDSRVRWCSTGHLGAPSGAKLSGQGNQTSSSVVTWARKRALRRARNRAHDGFGTHYRGKWHTPAMLGLSRGESEPPTEPRPRRAVQNSGRQGKQRIRVLTYNIGGLSFDVFEDWLATQKDADVIILQELHHGCGKQDTQWIMKCGWKAVTTADAAHRYSGVGIFLAPWIVRVSAVSICPWYPGRLHVRCEMPKLNLDIVGLYQFVERSRDGIASNEARRSEVWGALSRLLHGIPKRNLFCIGADMNSVCDSLPGLVGRGLMPHPHRDADVELQNLLQEHQLVALNTWGNSRSSHAHTFRHGTICSQIDFLLTRRVAADPAARIQRP